MKHLKHLKAQVALEFLLFSSIFLVAFLAVLLLINLYGSQESEGTSFLISNELASRLASEISFAYSMGEGFSYRISLPKKLAGKDYTVYIANGTESSVFVVIPSENNLTAVSSMALSLEDCPNKNVNLLTQTLSCELKPGKSYSISVGKGGVLIKEVGP